MSLINLRNITIAYESNTIVREANFRLNEKERVGLIGKNGTGKTSLLRCLLDELNPTAGEIRIDPNLRIGYFSQFSRLDLDKPIIHILQELFERENSLEERLEAIGDKLGETSDPEKLESLINQQNELLEEMDALDGWNRQIIWTSRVFESWSRR